MQPAGRVRRPRARWGRAGSALLIWLVALGGPALSAEASLIVKKPKSASSTRIARELSRALGAGEAARIVDLTGNSLVDRARVSREARGQPILFAIGPDATETAQEAENTAVVSIGVANPARLKTPGIYVSVYPDLGRVFEYMRDTLGASRVGLLFTPAKNREVALGFMKAAETRGVGLVPVPVRSSGDLIRQLKKALPNIEVLLLAVDPILFDRRSFGYIVEQARRARIPTVGFLEEMTGNSGVTLSLVASPEATAAVAVEASRDPVFVGKRRVEVDRLRVVVSRRPAAAIGLRPEALGAVEMR